MKKLAKKFLQSVLPETTFAALAAVSARRFSERVERNMGLDRLTREYVAKHGRTVLGGPFKGLQYTPATDARHVGARLVGCYENEIAAAVESACAQPFKRVIDVGCAEGYYAVGFAMRMPATEVVAFDTDPWARRVCSEMAALNGVAGRVRVTGFCSTSVLRETIGNDRCLVVLDCEGYEAVLLDPQAVPNLDRCDIIVELHDAAPAPDHFLVQRFAASHHVEILPGRPRRAEEAALADAFSDADRLRLIDELRHAWQGWVVLRSRKLGA